jgi:hypothetical protein
LSSRWDKTKAAVKTDDASSQTDQIDQTGQNDQNLDRSSGVADKAEQMYDVKEESNGLDGLSAVTGPVSHLGHIRRCVVRSLLSVGVRQPSLLRPYHLVSFIDIPFLAFSPTASSKVETQEG